MRDQSGLPFFNSLRYVALAVLNILSFSRCRSQETVNQDITTVILSLYGRTLISRNVIGLRCTQKRGVLGVIYVKERCNKGTMQTKEL